MGDVDDLLRMVRASLHEDRRDPWRGQGLDEVLVANRSPDAIKELWKRSWENKDNTSRISRPVGEERKEDPWQGAGLAETLRPTLRKVPSVENVSRESRVLPSRPSHRRQREEAAWGGGLEDVLVPTIRPQRSSAAYEPTRASLPHSEEEKQDWGGGLGDVLVPSVRQRQSSAAYEPRRSSHRHQNAEDDWGGSLGDVLVPSRRPRRDSTPYESRRHIPTLRQPEDDAWSGGGLEDVLSRRRQSRTRVTSDAPRRAQNFSGDFMRDDEMTYERLLALDAPAAKDNKLSRERRKQVEKVLKSKVYDPSDKDTSCVVCLEEFSSRDKQIKQLPCRHLFHRKCISKWLDHDLRCPTCRTDILSSAA